MTVLHEFVGSRAGDSRNFPDGLLPISLIQGADGNFYGTTLQSAQSSNGTFLGLGTIFSISPTGSFTHPAQPRHRRQRRRPAVRPAYPGPRRQLLRRQ